MDALLTLFGIDLKPGTAVELWWDAPAVGLMLVVLAGVAVALGALAWRSVRGAAPWRAAVVVGLRVLAVALLGAMLLGPAAVLMAPAEGRERLAVMVDASRSMSVSTTGSEDAPTRWQEAMEALGESGPLADLAQYYDLEYFTFTDALTAVGDATLMASIPPDGEATDLGSSLQQLVSEGRDLTLGGVLVVSDGVDRGPLRRAFEGDDGLGANDEALLKALSPLDLPIHTLSLGGEEGFVDLAIDSLDVGDFAFLRQPTNVTVSLRAIGLAGRRTQVRLSQGRQTLGAQAVDLGADGEVVKVTFPLKPDRVGKFTYTLSTPVLASEAIAGNNTRSFTLKVVRDRVRVLQIAGAPSWDEKFMRRLLKTDPNVDLVSFFILRTSLDERRPFRDQEFSLIEFPHRDLFDKDLGTFDLVIFQNFNYAPYFDQDSYRLLANLARFVEQGGGMAVLGGEKAFAGGEYGGTPLETVLPVRSDRSPSVVEKAFKFHLTPDGQRHPVTSLHFDPTENSRIWQRQPSMDGFNPVSLQPGAVVLGTGGESGPPILTVRQVGRGRTLALMTDTSWYWSFKATGGGESNGAYLRFWKNALRWLVGDPDEGQVQVDSDQENYRLGEKPVVSVHVVGVDYAPMAGAAVEVSVGPDGDPDPVVYRGVTSDVGEWSLPLAVDEVGAYRVKAVVRSGEGDGASEVGRAETVFAVNEEGAEMKELLADGAFLAALSRVSGGRALVKDDELDGPLEVRARPDSAHTQRTVIPLWDKPPAWAGLFFLLSFEWLLRRRWGMK